MPALEGYLEHAEKLAQEVVDTWGVNFQATNDALNAEFKNLLEKACRFREAKALADTHRKRGDLTQQAATEEREKRQAFAEAYKAFYEKPPTTS